MTNYIIIALLFLCIGFVVGFGRRYKNVDGLMILDVSDPEKDKWTIDLHIDPNDVQYKKEIRLKVVKIDDKDEEVV